MPPKPKTDTTGVDSTRVKTDTIKPPFGRSQSPRSADIGPQYSWNRDELFASGALNVAELLERVPGATSITTGGLNTQKFIALNGDMSRVRVFYDGIEFDNINPRTAPLLDLNLIQLWTLESVVVERSASELRLHLRTWQVNRTLPYTRVDVTTGDENINIYRGFYGKRFGSGGVLQVGANQYNTNARFGGGGDMLSIFARAGTAGKWWSVDAAAVTNNVTRTLQPTFGNGMSVPSFEAGHRLVYLRAAAGDVGKGPWAEVVASTQRLGEHTPFVEAGTAASRHVLADTADTTTKRHQLVVAAGITQGLLRASLTDRIRSISHDVFHAPAVRVEAAGRFGVAGVFAESDGFTSTKRIDGIVKLTPLPWVAVAGSVARLSPDSAKSGGLPRTTSARLEAGIKLFKPWLSAGFITRDTALLPGLRAVDTVYTQTVAGKRGGAFVALRGQLYRALAVDIVATHWDSVDVFRPRVQIRSELSLVTSWLSRFPSGNFGLRAALIHDYRGQVAFPTAAGNRLTGSSSVFSGLVEIRVLRGVASYRVTNIGYAAYQLVPDFFMPRTVNIYGLRWEFWN